MKRLTVALIVFLTALSAARAERLATTYANSLFDEADLAPPTQPAPKPKPERGGTVYREAPGVVPGTPMNPPLRTESLFPPPPGPRRPSPPPPPERPAPRPGRQEAPSRYSQYLGYDVWDPFYQNFKQCEPGCEPRVNNLYRPHSHGSCHQVGRAIDIDGIQCQGEGSFPAYRNARFERMVHCMQRKMPTLWKNGDHKTLGHHDHAHFSIRCGPGNRRM